jgi:hypothetical protein
VTALPSLAGSGPPALRALMLFDIRNAAQRRIAILDHVRFLDHAAPGEVHVAYVNMAEQPAFDPGWLEYDVIVLHTTLLCWRWHPQFPVLAGQLEWLGRYQGIVAAMPQDEYDHAHTLDDWLTMLKVQVVVTCFGEAPRPLLYPRMHNRAYFVQALTGYLHPARIPVARANALPQAQRSVDVVYRANNLPLWFGWLGHIKSRISTEAERVLMDTGLALDVSIRPEDTVLGDAWLQFLGTSRAILGSESGSSVLDRRGEVATHIRTLLAEYPGLTFENADALSAGELTRHHFAALGPRHLEAIMTGTVQILVEGEYSGVFKPWEHYIPVRRDLSDLHELPERLADHEMVQRIVDRSIADVVDSGAFGYDRFAAHFLDVIRLFRSVQANSATTALAS